MILIVLAFCLPATPAFAGGASTCPSGGNYLSEACNFIYLTPQYGAQDTFKYIAMAMSTADQKAGNHINNTLWAYGTGCGGINSGEQDWMEAGYTLGFHGTTGYHIYLATVVSGVYSDYKISDVSADNTSHAITIEVDQSSGFWSAYLDLTFIGEAGSGIGPFICQDDAGTEVSASSAFNKSTTSTGTFQNEPLKWENSSGTWNTGWFSTSQNWIDHPCGSGYSAPNCLNGVFYSTQYWADNKPS